VQSKPEGHETWLSAGRVEKEGSTKMIRKLPVMLASLK
jgi:hypothetical protein